MLTHLNHIQLVNQSDFVKVNSAATLAFPLLQCGTFASSFAFAVLAHRQLFLSILIFSRYVLHISTFILLSPAHKLRRSLKCQMFSYIDVALLYEIMNGQMQNIRGRLRAERLHKDSDV